MYVWTAIHSTYPKQVQFTFDLFLYYLTLQAYFYVKYNAKQIDDK